MIISNKRITKQGDPLSESIISAGRLVLVWYPVSLCMLGNFSCFFLLSADCFKILSGIRLSVKQY